MAGRSGGITMRRAVRIHFLADARPQSHDEQARSNSLEGDAEDGENKIRQSFADDPDVSRQEQG